MSLLILALPPGPPGPTASYAWARSDSGERLLDHGAASAELLPASGRGTEVVAVVPATLLSWHRAELPRGIGPRSPRLRAALAGLLEERLLDDPAQLHFALGANAPAGGATWVAACRRDWLAAHLQALDDARQSVARIVPEISPDGSAPALVAAGTADQPLLLASGAGVPGGAQALPLAAGSLALLHASLGSAMDDEASLQAEPAVAALAERLFRRPPALVPAAERLLQAGRSHWNLAQFDLARSGGARASQRLKTAARDFWHAPRWRPARWGLALLALGQLAGLNLAAWQARGELATQRASIDAMLRQTFPQVRLIVDAPVQMAREVAALRQQSGALSAQDLEPMLAAIGSIAGAAPTAIEFTPGELRLKGVALSAGELTQAQARLRPLGYRLDAAGAGENARTILREGARP